jgi:hypothetical protein
MKPQTPLTSRLGGYADIDAIQTFGRLETTFHTTRFSLPNRHVRESSLSGILQGYKEFDTLFNLGDEVFQKKASKRLYTALVKCSLPRICFNQFHSSWSPFIPLFEYAPKLLNPGL